ncbi:Cof-type HAD-IIB family hydrolase [Erysipelotrichaceae bacterium HCN-30851]
MIRLIAMDMDGTLLTSDNTISDKTKEALWKAQEKGVRLVLASGRSYCRLMDYAKELKMDQFGGFLLEVNGLIIYDLKNNQRFIRKQLDADDIKELFTYFSQWDVEFMAQFDDGMFNYNPESVLKEKAIYRKQHHIPDDYPWTGGAFSLLGDHRKGYPHFFNIKSYEEVNRTINKISITYYEDVMKKVSEQAKIDLGDRYWVGRTTPKWLEVMPKGITKASGLEVLSEQLGISMEEIMAFGDGENDIEMLETVGKGIAMGNAMEEVKAIADDVTLTNNEDGIAHAIHKYGI